MIEYLIPLGFLVAGTILLTGGAEALVASAQTLALRWGMSPLVVGLTIVAFSTSAPELVASMVAAWYGSPDLAIGNVVGSNIANVGLVLGLAAIISPLAVHRRVVVVDTPIALVLSILLVIFLWEQNIGRLEGAALVTGIVLYTSWRIWNTDPETDPLIVEETVSHELSLGTFWLVVITVLSIAALSGGAYLFVRGGQGLALLLGVPERVVGLTIMALGTSLPEVATALAAARKGLADIVVGNVIGSNIFNILSVAGFTALFFPMTGLHVEQIDLTVFVGSAMLVLGLMLHRLSVNRIEGSLLLAGYVAYVWYLYG